MGSAFFQIDWFERVAIVTMDDPERPINTLGAAALLELEKLLEELETREEIAGIILSSAKSSSFLAGADLRELESLESASQAVRWVERGQRLLARWRRLSIPSVAAIRGAALGGGLEVALACTHRLATDDPETRLGLPGVRLGLLPALGGTYRLPRTVGLEKGVEMLLTGRQLNARQAQLAGLVDRVVESGALQQTAREWIGRQARPTAPSFRDRLLAGNPLGRRLFFEGARRRVLQETGGLYPAPLRILEAVETGYARGEAAALAYERRHFGDLAVSSTSRRLVGLFLATRELAAGGQEPAAEAVPLAVVGAGFMGSGIAAAAARAGHAVQLIDQSDEALERAMVFCRHRFDSLESRHELQAMEAAAALSRIQSNREPDSLDRLELVIEAVVEDAEIKQLVFEELETQVAEGTVLASNTSTIPITRLAEGLRHPQRVIGMHFFSPVHRMPLVEIVRHSGTSERTLSYALSFVRSLGKTPIVVRDSPGFYTTRILAPYLAQGARMLREGASVDLVDAAARRAGFPVGPLELLDEVGIDVAAHAARTLAAAFGERLPFPAELEELSEQGRLGRKAGVGFYDYRGRSKRPDASIHELLGGRQSASLADRSGFGERFLLAMALEAVRCLEEEIIECARDGDVGAVLGLGFPPFRGGPFRYLDDLEAARAVSKAKSLAGRYGELFEPPELLQRQAKQGKHFYS